MGLKDGYRKYVWNDFSIVEKARIIIIESSGNYGIGSCMPGSKKELKFKEELPVQINPASFHYDYRINPNNILKNLTTSKLENSGFHPVTFGDYDTSSGIDIPLIFDIYDEYNARSMNNGLNSSMSLMKEGFTSLPSLIKYAQNPGAYYAMFKWGEIKRFGILTGITVDYTAFSPWGQPLKARADLHITEEPDEDVHIDKLENLPGGKTISKVSNTGKQILTGIKNIFR